MSADHPGDEPDRSGTPYEVGYGRPPKATRFKPGQSGNPKGRPKRKRRNYAEDRDAAWLGEIWLKEAYREITVRENGREVKLPVIQAALRSGLVAALKGSRLHLKMITDAVAAVELSESAARRALFERALDGKLWWKQLVEQHAKLGLPAPTPPIPHPDDVFIDPRRGTVEISGAHTEEEVRKIESAAADRDQLIRCYTSLPPEGDPGLDGGKEALRSVIDQINAVLPARYRREP